jgi:hypothetical protein
MTHYYADSSALSVTLLKRDPRGLQPSLIHPPVIE